MINSHRPGAPSLGCRLLSLLVLLACFPVAALATKNITGSVRNLTRAEPAAGDQVILLRMEKEMREESRLKTDAGGMFSFNVQYSDKPYLVRVIHEGVSYDQPTAAGDVLAISVFDAAPRVPGITGGIEILRAGTNGSLLHVSDMVEILNDSNPPRTQAGDRAFEIYLPPNARMDSVLAAGPGKIAAIISAVPVPGDPGHYTLAFPLRPGASKFAFNYDLPYEGRAAFQTRHAYPLQQLAVMIPPTMKFSSRSRAFQMLAVGNSRYQVQAANRVGAGNGPDFELAGTGALPPLEGQAGSQAHPQPIAPLNPAPSAAPALLPSSARMDLDLKQTKPQSQTLVLGVVTVVLLAICALLLWRARKPLRFSRSAGGRL